MKVSTTGYKRNSKDKKHKQLYIPGDVLTMLGVDDYVQATPVYPNGSYGGSVTMKPGVPTYNFPGAAGVIEQKLPQAQKGLSWTEYLKKRGITDKDMMALTQEQINQGLEGIEKQEAVNGKYDIRNDIYNNILASLVGDYDRVYPLSSNGSRSIIKNIMSDYHVNDRYKDFGLTQKEAEDLYGKNSIDSDLNQKYIDMYFNARNKYTSQDLKDRGNSYRDVPVKWVDAYPKQKLKGIANTNTEFPGQLRVDAENMFRMPVLYDDQTLGQQDVPLLGADWMRDYYKMTPGTEGYHDRPSRDFHTNPAIYPKPNYSVEGVEPVPSGIPDYGSTANINGQQYALSVPDQNYITNQYYSIPASAMPGASAANVFVDTPNSAWMQNYKNKMGLYNVTQENLGRLGQYDPDYRIQSTPLTDDDMRVAGYENQYINDPNVGFYQESENEDLAKKPCKDCGTLQGSIASGDASNYYQTYNVQYPKQGILEPPKVTDPNTQKVLFNTDKGDIYKVQDRKTKRLIGYEDFNGNPIDINNPNGTPANEFYDRGINAQPNVNPGKEVKRIATPPGGFKEGGETDHGKVSGRSKTKAGNSNYLLNQTFYEDGFIDNNSRRTLKGFITGAPKPGEPGAPAKLANGGELPKAQYGPPDWNYKPNLGVNVNYNPYANSFRPKVATAQSPAIDVRKVARPTAVAESTKVPTQKLPDNYKELQEQKIAQDAYDALPEAMKRRDTLTADTRSDAEKFARRAWTAVSQPMETIAAVNRGYDIPSGYMGMHDAYEGYGVGSPMTSVVDLPAGIAGFIGNAAYRQGEQIVDDPLNYAYTMSPLGLIDSETRGQALGNYLDLAAVIPTARMAAGPLVKNAGKFLTTQTPLKNAYKYNPWAFKPNPEAYYRMLGKEGYADALESGLLRSNPGKGGLQTQQFDDVYFSMKHPWDGRDYGYVTKSGEPIGGVGYKGPYMAELTGQELNHPISSFPRANMAQSKVPISLENPGLKLYKEDWLKGYKAIDTPTVLPGSPNLYQYQIRGLAGTNTSTGLTEENVADAISRQKDWLKSEEYVKRRSANTGETLQEVRQDRDKILSVAEDARFNLNSNITAQGQMTPKSLFERFPKVEIAKHANNPINTLEHETAHLYSPSIFGKSDAATHKGLLEADVANLPSSERGVYANYPTLGEGFDKTAASIDLGATENYLKTGPEQQVRHLNARADILKANSLPMDAQLTEAEVKPFIDDWAQRINKLTKDTKDPINLKNELDYDEIWLEEAYKIRGSLLKEYGVASDLELTPLQRKEYVQRTKDELTKNVTSVLNKAWVAVPGAIGVGVATQQKKKGGPVNKRNHKDLDNYFAQAWSKSRKTA